MYNLYEMYKKSPILVQTFMLNMKALELYFERYGNKFKNLSEIFNKNQWISENDIKEWQNKRLRALIHHAYQTTPYYRDVFHKIKLKPDDIKTLDDISKIPILTKDLIKQNYKRLISSTVPFWKIRHGHTSGTTGTPLDIVYDVGTCVAHHAADWRQKNWAGLKYGEPYASLQGRVIVPVDQKKPPFWRKNYINNQIFFSSFHLKYENIQSYLDKMASDNIQHIEGYPSTIFILAMYLKKKGATFPMKAVLTSSETLFDFQRTLIEDRFCCKIFDFYGMAERAVFAGECDHHKGYHLNEDYGLTEFLDDLNEPVPIGNIGHIVATSLHNFAMPLIRYKTNDSCALKNEPCTCGRGFALMDGVATKNESIVTLSDGRLISPSVLTHPFKPMDNILESQIIQVGLDELKVRIVKNEKYTSDDERLLVSAFKERLGGIRISIEYCDSIQRTKSGKFKWVVSNIRPQI